jgi:hypothetical protein
MSDAVPLSRWAFAVLRPVVRLLRAAGVTEEIILAHVSRALALHRQDTVRGRLDAPMTQAHVRALGNLLARWSRSAEWAGADGMPRDLPIVAGEAGGFAELVAAVSSTLRADEALALLEQFGTVVRVADGQRVRLLSAALLHASDEGFAAEPVLADLRRFARTIEYNVFEKGASGPGRFQMSTLRAHLDPAQLEAFDRYLRRSGQVFLTAADDELARYEDPGVKEPEGFGVGVFMFREDPKDRNPAV